MPGKEERCFIYFSYRKLYPVCIIVPVSSQHYKTDWYISIWISSEASHCCKKLKPEKQHQNRREAPTFSVHAGNVHSSCPAVFFTVCVHKDKTKIIQRPSLSWSARSMRSKLSRKQHRLLFTGISSSAQNLDKEHDGQAYKRTKSDLYFETRP